MQPSDFDLVAQTGHDKANATGLEASSQMRGVVATALCRRALARSNARAPRRGGAATTFTR
jgi:hypothetical protein